ncbi:hypothetical protein B0H19DRAFT_967854 [Mycena capillaripes]|nr:hypothetical protein B0H19DRAFT_967854 [Mycena capillaripes]
MFRARLQAPGPPGRALRSPSRAGPNTGLGRAQGLGFRLLRPKPAARPGLEYPDLEVDQFLAIFFSAAGITISKGRNRLKGDIVEALQFLKCLIRRDLLFRVQR